MQLSILLQLLCCTLIAYTHDETEFNYVEDQDEFAHKDELPMDKKIEQMQKQIDSLSRQLMLQQFYTTQRVRTEGNSGLKQIRVTVGGLKNYQSQSHTGRSAASIHDHANNIRTVGLGEFVAVLNGVEFRTRHNDYRLVMPSKTSSDYHKVEDVPFPGKR